FELRPLPTPAELAKPSGMLDLHDESGLAAIRACDLYAAFTQRTTECSEAQKVADQHGAILYQDGGEASERPEISRHALSALFLAQLPPDCIKWEHKLRSAKMVETSNGSSSSSTTTAATTPGAHTETTLDFGPQNGTHTFDLVVGADGAWSKVRALLTPETPHYAGIQNITLTIRHISTAYPALAALVGSGSFTALAHHQGIMSQRGPQDSARIYIFVRTPDERFAHSTGLAGMTPAAAKPLLLDDADAALLHAWGPALKDLVAAACAEETADNPGAPLDIRPMYSLPAVGHTWASQRGATLVGDAAHLMGPWAGEGVNLALWDALLLAEAIGKAYRGSGGEQGATGAAFQEALAPLMGAFEVGMAARAREKAEESVANGEMLFGEDAATAFVNFFLSAIATG
ncbi:salicylate hydroxylase, partial [Massariosphaeria phaeospora]